MSPRSEFSPPPFYKLVSSSDLHLQRDSLGSVRLPKKVVTTSQSLPFSDHIMIMIAIMMTMTLVMVMMMTVMVMMMMFPVS